MKRVRCKGFSLIEVIIALGVMSAGAFFMMKMNEDNQKALNNMAMTQGITVKVAEISKRLTQQKVCENNFGGLNIGDTLTNLNDSEGHAFMTVGDTYGQNASQFRISSISLESGSSTSFKLILTFEKLGSFIGLKNVRRELSIPATVEGSGEIEACRTSDEAVVAASVEQACHGMGAIFDSDTKTCSNIGMISTSCPPGQAVREVIYNFSANAMEPVCKPIIEDISCPGGIQFVDGIASCI